LSGRAILVGLATAWLVACSPVVSPAIPAPTASAVASPSNAFVPATPSAPPIPSPSPTLSPSPSPTPEPTHCPGSDKTPNRVARVPLKETSPTWAGYVIYKTRTSVTCVEGSWLQPKVTCPSTGELAVAIWVGMDGLDSPTVGVDSSRTLEQVGTEAECSGGALRMFAWHEVLPAEQSAQLVETMTVSQGDRLWAMVEYTGDATFTLRIRDITRDESFAIDEIVEGAPRLTAEWIVEAPSTGCATECTISALPKFTTVTFTGAFLSTGSQRASISDDNWRNGAIEMIRSQIVRVSVSSLTAKGTTFGVTWRHR
jgi:Peptidase A4 family